MAPTAGVFQNIRVYWLAFIVYWGIVLFGYDTGIAGGVVAQDYFHTHFGLIDSTTGKVNQSKLDAVTSNIVSVLQAGAFFGALASAPCSQRYGRKPTLMLFTLIFSVGAVLTTIPSDNASSVKRGLGLIYAGRVVSGFGIGAISAVAPAYVSECCPKEVRGRITGCFQIMVAIGVMLSYFINYGISQNVTNSALIWQLPFGFQLVPAGIMLLGLFTVKESPRFLASTNKRTEAIENLAYLRRRAVDDHEVVKEMAEIEATVEEERVAREGLGWREAFTGKGNGIRFILAFTIFVLQQWAGQNSVGYYAPQIFASIGYSSTKSKFLASGIYGVVKVAATAIFVFFFVESLGRKISLFISAMGMGTLFYIIGAILKTHPPQTNPVPANPSPSSQAMAGLLYIYVCFYSMGWGPLPWVYVSDIFPTRTRHYGLALASSSQWMWNFVVSKVTPTLITKLGWKIFVMFATINIAAMGVFSLLIPETKGRSLEDMDVIFGSITAEERARNIERQEKHGQVQEPGAAADVNTSKSSVEKDSMDARIERAA